MKRRSFPEVSRALATGRIRSDAGALTLSYVMAVPALLTGLMLIAQASVWYLARDAALAAARQGADAARTAQASPAAGTRVAVTFARQAAPGFLLAPRASAAGSSASTIRITVTGRVPSLVPGLALEVSEVVTAPVERFIAVAGPPGPTRHGSGEP
jgi:hypothetical protein